MRSHLFGEHLKREREMRNVSLEEVSAATRISVRFLEALEDEQWERLPGGVFNRGFIRSVARFLGLDEEGLIAEYAMETRERPEIAVWTKEPVHPRTNWTWVMGTIVALLLLVGGVWFAHVRYGPAFDAWHQAHPIAKAILNRFHRRKAADANTQSGAAAAVTPQTSAHVPAEGTPNAGPYSGKAQGYEKAASPAESATSSQATGDTPLELKVEAGETSEVTVIADGKSVFSGRLEALRSLSFSAQKSFTVTSSKSSAVLLELNGHTVPPLGPPGQPGKITLTHENLNPGRGGED